VNICFIHRFDTVEKYMAFANWLQYSNILAVLELD